MIDKVVACIDDSPSAGIVCDWTSWLSTQFDAEILLLHVLEKSVNHDRSDYSGNLGVDSRENLLAKLVELDAKRAKIELKQGKIMLEHATHRIQAKAEQTITSIQRHDELLPAVQAQLNESSLLILGKQGTSGDEIGSHIERITRQIKQPILITPNREFTAPKRIMLAYDGKEIAKHALEFLAHSPLSDFLEVHIVMVGDYSQDELNFPALTFIESSKQAEIKRYPIPQNSKTLTDTLLAHARSHDIDVLAIGAFGNSALRRLFLGSTTLDTLQHAHIPVLLLR